jgi:hypothetical protein
MKGISIHIDDSNYYTIDSTSFQSPKKRKPLKSVGRLNNYPLLTPQLRHDPGVDIVEPKVFSPHKTRKGFAPRRIEVERKKRTFKNLDITEQLKANGAIDELIAATKYKGNDSVIAMPLSLFDNLDYESRSNEFWSDLIVQSAPKGLNGRAMRVEYDKEGEMLVYWEKCRVMSADLQKNTFEVVFGEIHNTSELFIKGYHQHKLSDEENIKDSKHHILERIYICFDSEDPKLYCQRISEALSRRKIAQASIALNLYIDCMPIDNLKPLDSEQVTRILNNSINTPDLKRNTSLNTSTILKQYNLNHMRTLNQLVFLNLLTKHMKEIVNANPMSIDPTILPQANDVFPKRQTIVVNSETLFEEKLKAFRFSSLWNKTEAISIMMHIQAQNIHLEASSFFFTPEKTMRLEEFNINQNNHFASFIVSVKETWANAITNSIRHNLKDVKKVRIYWIWKTLFHTFKFILIIRTHEIYSMKGRGQKLIRQI